MASGSGKRQRTRQRLIRFTEQEFAEVEAKADRAGMATAAFLRAAALGDPGPRAKRRPPADHRALRQLLGELGRVGNNLNQIAHRLHTGERARLPELQDALNAYLKIRDAIFDALGMNTLEDVPPRPRAATQRSREKPKGPAP